MTSTSGTTALLPTIDVALPTTDAALSTAAAGGIWTGGLCGAYAQPPINGNSSMHALVQRNERRIV